MFWFRVYHVHQANQNSSWSDLNDALGYETKVDPDAPYPEWIAAYQETVQKVALAALLKGKDLATAVQWGAAHGILVQETPGDTTLIEQKLVEAEAKRAASKSGVRATR